MAYSENLAVRIRTLLAHRDDVSERRMFGGLCFMIGGHMALGPMGDEIMVRVGREDYELALEQPHARVMDFTGRVSKTMVYVGAPGIAEDSDLEAWIGRAIRFVSTLPPK